MPSVLHHTFYRTKRKGISIVESLILMLVLGVTFGAIFSTLGWAHRTHASSRHDRESRVLLFNWVQTFESFFHLPPAPGDALVLGTVGHALTASAEVTRLLGGTSSTITGANRHTGQIGFFTVEATPVVAAAPNDGRLDLTVVIRSEARRAPWVDLVKSFNRFSNDTVADALVNNP